MIVFLSQDLFIDYQDHTKPFKGTINVLIGKGLTDNSNTFQDVDLYSHKVEFTNSWIRNPFASTPDKTVNFMTAGDPFEYKADANTFLIVRF